MYLRMLGSTRKHRNITRNLVQKDGWRIGRTGDPSTKRGLGCKPSNIRNKHGHLWLAWLPKGQRTMTYLWGSGKRNTCRLFPGVLRLFSFIFISKPSKLPWLFTQTFRIISTINIKFIQPKITPENMNQIIKKHQQHNH